MLEPLSAQQLRAYTDQWQLSEALRLVEQGKLDQALEQAKLVLTKHPDLAPAHEVLGIIQVLQGKLDEGLTNMQRAVQLNSKQTSAITKIGDVYLARNEVDKAKSQFEQALMLNPADRWAHQRLGLIYEQQRDIDQAIKHFEQGIVETPPDYLGIKVNLGRLYNLSHQYSNTVALLGKIVGPDCASASAHLVLGTAELGLRKTTPALACFERARKLEPQEEKVHLGLGVAYREAGDLKKAELELAQALELRPGWTAGHWQMAETLAEMGRIAEAMKHYTQAAANWTNQTIFKTRMAEVYSSRDMPEEALALYESLRSSGKSDLRAYTGHATLLQKCGKYSEAEAVLREGCQEYPENSFAHYRLGAHYALVRQYPPALLELQKARKLAPANPAILKSTSLVELRMDKLDDAISTARRLLELVPTSVDDLVYLAALLEKKNQVHDAAVLYQQALQHSSSNVVALNNLALIRLNGEEFEAALRLAKQAAALAPSEAAVQDTYGWALYHKGDFGAARTAVERAIGRNGANPTYRYHLAAVYARTGLKAQALEQARLATEHPESFPEREAAIRLLADLRRGDRP